MSQQLMTAFIVEAVPVVLSSEMWWSRRHAQRMGQQLRRALLRRALSQKRSQSLLCEMRGRTRWLHHRHCSVPRPRRAGPSTARQ